MSYAYSPDQGWEFERQRTVGFDETKPPEEPVDVTSEVEQRSHAIQLRIALGAFVIGLTGFLWGIIRWYRPTARSKKPRAAIGRRLSWPERGIVALGVVMAILISVPPILLMLSVFGLPILIGFYLLHKAITTRYSPPDRSARRLRLRSTMRDPGQRHSHWTVNPDIGDKHNDRGQQPN